MKAAIIVSTYNRADVLPLCLNALLAQKGPDFEILVANDKSTDGTESILKKFEKNDCSRDEQRYAFCKRSC